MTQYIDNVFIEGLNDIKSFRTRAYVAATANGTYTLTATSENLNIFTGTTAGQIIKLPNATTLTNGHRFYFVNASTNTLAVQNNGGTQLGIQNVNGRALFLLQDNSTTNGVWVYAFASGSSLAGVHPVFATYVGNALSGRYLEIFPGISSDEAHYLVIGDWILTALSLGTSALNTGTVSVYKMTDLVNPIASISLSNQNSASVTGLAYKLAAGDELAVKVSSGTLNKPYFVMYLGA